MRRVDARAFAENRGALQDVTELSNVPYVALLREDNVRQGFFEEHQHRSVLEHPPRNCGPSWSSRTSPAGALL